jgi:L-threonylcarbamoyladenylate synthase
MNNQKIGYPKEELIAGVLQGKVISFPTDTVPALAVKPEFSSLIFNLKQREQTKPLILMGAYFTDFLPYIEGTPQELHIWQEMANRYFPGALTLVLPASPKLPQAMNPLDSSTIGIRIPDLKIARDILSQTTPLATTSANFSGFPPLRNMTEIAQQFPDVLTLECDDLNSMMGSGLPSTVAKWTGSDWQILRQGSIKL